MKAFILILMMIPILGIAQTNDTIVKKDGKQITGTITLVNETSVYYKDKKGYGDNVLLNDISFYSQNGKRTNVLVPLDNDPNALFIDNVNINKLDIKYCELAGFDLGVINSKIIIYIDYGQFIADPQQMTIKDAKGKTLRFNSMVEALNFMEKNGWNYKNQFVSPSTTSLFGKTGALYRYLLVKK